MPATASSVELKVRNAVAQDAPVIADIYNQGIEERRATFQTSLHDGDDFLARISDEKRPFLVAESDGDVVAWATVAPYSDPSDYYAGVGEAMLYVERSARRRGVGSRLLSELAAAAGRRGFYKLVGKIFTTNVPSIKLVRRCGWREVGTHHKHGQIEGEWKDVLVVERLLGEAASTKNERRP
jgi:L-amino acid N-acyltransferase YncA